MKVTHADLPIIALTAHAQDSDRERCLEHGMDDHITKPVNAAKILEIIQSVTAGAV